MPLLTTEATSNTEGNFFLKIAWTIPSTWRPYWSLYILHTIYKYKQSEFKHQDIVLSLSLCERETIEKQTIFLSEKNH